MKNRARGWIALWLWLCVLVAVAACAGRAEDLTAIGGDSESHFLAYCTPGSCEGGLSCWYGLCTESCSTDAECADQASRAVCRSLPGAEPTLALCDLGCGNDADCAGLDANSGCVGGFCRVTTVGDGVLYGSCSPSRPCAEGMTCFDNTCSLRCESDTNCETGARCFQYADPFGLRQDYCAYSCDAPPENVSLGHDECSMLGDGGRCVDGACRETFTSTSLECQTSGSIDSEWSCYQDVAEATFQLRHEQLLAAQLCLPAYESHVYRYDYRRCGDTTCANGEAGCALSGLVLETEPAVIQNDNFSTPMPLMTARGEIRTREPLQVSYDLLDPAERCEYSVDVRFYSLGFFDAYSYRSPYSADQWGQQGGNISTDAVAGGYWQVVREPYLGHDAGFKGGAIIEDSDARVELLAGGERCADIREFVGVATRSDLVNHLNGLLDTWLRDIDDTLDCTLCGRVSCEMACRFR